MLDKWKQPGYLFVCKCDTEMVQCRCYFQLSLAGVKFIVERLLILGSLLKCKNVLWGQSIGSQTDIQTTTVLNAFTTADRGPQELFKLKMVSSEKWDLLLCFVFNVDKSRIEVMLWIVLT